MCFFGFIYFLLFFCAFCFSYFFLMFFIWLLCMFFAFCVFFVLFFVFCFVVLCFFCIALLFFCFARLSYTREKRYFYDFSFFYDFLISKDIPERNAVVLYFFDPFLPTEQDLIGWLLYMVFEVRVVCEQSHCVPRPCRRTVLPRQTTQRRRPYEHLKIIGKHT